MRSVPLRVPLALGGVLAALVLLALAAGSYRPFVGESGGDRPASTTLVDSAFTVALLVAAAAVVVAITARLREIRAGQGRDSGSRGLRQLIVLLVVVLAATGLGKGMLDLDRRPEGTPPEEAVPGRSKLPRSPAQPPPEEQSEPRAVHIVWPVAGAVAALVVAGLAAAYVLRRRRREREGPTEEEIAGLRAALDEAIEDLRREPDPRRAVVAAYARMEQALVVHGIPRRPSETPQEYLTRAAEEIDAQAAMAVLTELFEEAKFSEHTVGEGMRGQAIDALVAVRDEVRAAS